MGKWADAKVHQELKKRHVLRVSFPNVEGKFTEINDFIHGEIMLELSLCGLLLCKVSDSELQN